MLNYMVWGLKIWQIVLAVVVFPFLAGIGIFSLQTLQDRNFQPQTIQQQTIDQRQIQQQSIRQQQLAPARTLIGDWRGAAVYRFYQTDIAYCDMTFNVSLSIDNNEGSNFGGNVRVIWLKAEQHGNFACAQVPPTLDPVNGTINSSRITLNAGSQGNFTGSITSNTMTLNQPKQADGSGLVSPIHLLRNN